MQRAMAQTFTRHNFKRIEMVHFTNVQKALIGFQNDDMDELFNFYDARNKTRFTKLKSKTKSIDKFVE